MFEINYVNIAKGEDYYIIRHLFVEQDARPLYSWPEKDVDGRSNRKLRIQKVNLLSCNVYFLHYYHRFIMSDLLDIYLYSE